MRAGMIRVRRRGKIAALCPGGVTCKMVLERPSKLRRLSLGLFVKRGFHLFYVKTY